MVENPKLKENVAHSKICKLEARTVIWVAKGEI